MQTGYIDRLSFIQISAQTNYTEPLILLFFLFYSRQPVAPRMGSGIQMALHQEPRGLRLLVDLSGLQHLIYRTGTADFKLHRLRNGWSGNLGRSQEKGIGFISLKETRSSLDRVTKIKLYKMFCFKMVEKKK